MAGYTDAAFRTVCLRHGAPLCFAEMVSADGLAHGDATTLRLLARAENEKLAACQIFASSPSVAAVAVRRLLPLHPAIIDLNCGCSVPKVLTTGCGAALMRSPDLVGSIVAAMKAETDVPVSVKLRSGWDSSTTSYLACAEKAVRSGASLVTLHPRHRAQGFGGKARWEHIRELKTAAAAMPTPVPVFGSGDLFSAKDCAEMITSTGCDGVMIARGCLGNPFIFEQARALLSGEPAPAEQGAEARLNAALDHLAMLAAAVGEPKACRDMRKHFVAYTKGMPGGSLLRQSVVQAATIEEYREIVESYLRA
jgi:tRNA-dihydrouridine synthase B